MSTNDRAHLESCKLGYHFWQEFAPGRYECAVCGIVE